MPFQSTVYLKSVVSFVEISGIQIYGWLHEVSELSACVRVRVRVKAKIELF